MGMNRCKDCRHSNVDGRFAECRAGDYKKMIWDPIQGYVRFVFPGQNRNPRSKNKDGDCPDYFRKWWLFWRPQ